MSGIRNQVAKLFAACSERLLFSYLPARLQPLVRVDNAEDPGPWRNVFSAHGWPVVDPSDQTIAVFFWPQDGTLFLNATASTPTSHPEYTAVIGSLEEGFGAEVLTGDAQCPKTGVLVAKPFGTDELAKIVRGISLHPN